MSKIEISKELLEDIRHELMTLTGLKAFDSCGDGTYEGAHYWQVDKEDLIDLDFEEICTKIDEVL